MRRGFHSTHLCEACMSPVGRRLQATNPAQRNRRSGRVRHHLRRTTTALSRSRIAGRMFVP